MEATKIGIREFRENLASYLESKTPVAITRHGATIGIYVPTKPKPNQADLEALRIAGEKVQQMIAAAGTAEDGIIADLRNFDANDGRRRADHACARHDYPDSRGARFQSASLIEHLPEILSARKIAVAPAMEMLDLVTGLIQTVEAEAYSLHEVAARERIGQRDENDWPILRVHSL